MTFSIDNPEWGLQQPPLGKYVREKPSGEQGLKKLFFLFLFIYFFEKIGLKELNFGQILGFTTEILQKFRL